MRGKVLFYPDLSPCGRRAVTSVWSSLGKVMSFKIESLISGQNPSLRTKRFLQLLPLPALNEKKSKSVSGGWTHPGKPSIARWTAKRCGCPDCFHLMSAFRKTSHGTAKTVRTSVWKTPVDGRRMVRKLDIDGNAQADPGHGGGENRAVFVYQMDSYQLTGERILGPQRFYSSASSEKNFTVEGLPDSGVCIGDRYRIGGAVFEVTQPRVTCYRVGIRMNEPRMPALLVEHHRPGGILLSRVLQ